MGRAERPSIGQRAVVDLAGDRRNHRDFQQLGRRERRQNRRQPRREHRFAGTRRTNHEKVMSARSRDLERALGAFLSFDVREVEHAGVTFANFGLRPRKNLRTLEVIGELDQRLRGDDLDFGTGPGRFGPACVRADQALAASVGADRGRQHTGNRGDRAVEAELPQNGEAVQRIVRNCADGRHETERDR